MAKRLLAVRELGILAVLALEIMIFAWLLRRPGEANTFLNSQSMLNAVRESAVLGLAAIGASIVIVSGGIDLAVGSIIALVTVVGARLMTLPEPLPIALAVPIAIGCGALCGAVSGAVICRAKLPPFIVTLGMMSVVRGTAFLITRSRTISLPRDSWLLQAVGQGEVGLGRVACPNLALILLVVAAVFAWAMSHTALGRRIVAVGGNEQAARLSGVPVERVKLWVYGLAGGCAGLAGVAYLAKYGAGQSTAATGWELDAIASAVLGGASLSGGRGSVVGACLGALIFRLLQKGLTMLGASDYQQVIVGLVVIVAVVVDQMTVARARRMGGT